MQKFHFRFVYFLGFENCQFGFEDLTKVAENVTQFI